MNDDYCNDYELTEGNQLYTSVYASERELCFISSHARNISCTHMSRVAVIWSMSMTVNEALRREDDMLDGRSFKHRARSRIGRGLPRMLKGVKAACGGLDNRHVYERTCQQDLEVSGWQIPDLVGQIVRLRSRIWSLRAKDALN